jgi:hypothetical protein
MKRNFMDKQMSHPCDELVQQWQAKRELANYYFTALLRLSPDAPDAVRQRQEFNEKVFDALLTWKQVDDQLQSCYQEYGQKN